MPSIILDININWYLIIIFRPIDMRGILKEIADVALEDPRGGGERPPNGRGHILFYAQNAFFLISHFFLR